ncbi:MAG: Hint domain-containing protein, partial [Leptolyngbyaceae bacterium]|nr:Hint domain-containing protein [Leptolyngbyaceae bacterium]
TSWSDAYTDLQTAIAAADPGDQIWVATGTYTPGADRTDTFTLDQAIEIYGGFAGTPGTEGDISQQDFETNPTILSGDIGMANNSSDNSHHVVTVSSTVVLDGIIVQGGNTSGATLEDGAGIYNTSAGSLSLRNAIVQDNIAVDDGGGIRNDGVLTIYNSTIQGNTAIGASETSGGGGLINTTSGTVTIISSTFSSNTSGKSGGAIRNDGSMRIVGSTLSGNTAAESGGAIVNTTSDITIISSTITNNTANNTSGAPFGSGGGSVGGGGGIANVASVTLANTIVAGNMAGNGGNDDLQDSFAFGTQVGTTIETLGNNLIGDGDNLTRSNLVNGVNNDQVGTAASPISPELQPLTDNGGFTQTHQPTVSSPTLDTGNGSLSTGLSETTLGFDITGDGNADDTDVSVDDLSPATNVDIGAFEIQECFLAGTLILTEGGEKPVEKLKIGDRLLTASGTVEIIKWIGRQTYHRHTAHPFRSNPIHIKPGALGHNLPLRDLYVSPDHALLVNGLLINAGVLTNGVSIVQIQPEQDRFTYYHIELGHHGLLLAEGCAAESYLPQTQDHSTFDNAEEYEALYPTQLFLSLLPMNYPRVSSKRQLPSYVAKRLEQLGRSLYPQPITEQTA